MQSVAVPKRAGQKRRCDSRISPIAWTAESISDSPLVAFNDSASSLFPPTGPWFGVTLRLIVGRIFLLSGLMLMASPRELEASSDGTHSPSMGLTWAALLISLPHGLRMKYSTRATRCFSRACSAISSSAASRAALRDASSVSSSVIGAGPIEVVNAAKTTRPRDGSTNHDRSAVKIAAAQS